MPARTQCRNAGLHNKREMWYASCVESSIGYPSQCFVTGMQSPLQRALPSCVTMTQPPGKPKTFVYIDGFNLYYGCFRSRGRQHWAKYKWLDLEKFCDSLFPKNDVVKIKYYTADVNNRPPDNQQGNRQRAYLTALSGLARVEIIKGHFLGPTVVRMPQCDEAGEFLGHMVTVLKTEEKGSDVNLAVDLLFDCVRNLYRCAIIISNDSDLVAPIRIVREEYRKIVGVVNPHPTRPSVELLKNADFRKRLTEKAMASSQLPDTVRVGSTVIQRPAAWG